jgi:hypothetical protein
MNQGFFISIKTTRSQQKNIGTVASKTILSNPAWARKPACNRTSAKKAAD